MPAHPRARRARQGAQAGDLFLSTPTFKEVLAFIAEAEDLEETLAHFNGLSRANLTRLLLQAADRLGEERPAVPASERVAAPASQRQKRATASQTGRAVLLAWSDGASRGNPGQASVGVVLRAPDGRIVDTIARAIGVRTNNFAEYEAVRSALERARTLGADRVELHADSELVIKQLRGEYKVKNESLRPLFEAVKRAEAEFEGGVVYKHVPREKNADADALANQALDEL